MPKGKAKLARRIAVSGALLLACTALVTAGPLVSGQQWASDPWLEQPVDDATFEAFLDFFAYDEQLPFDVELLEEVEREGVLEGHISFRSTPDQRVTARLYRQPGSDAGRPGVIMLHGGVAVGKDSPGVVRLARVAARDGWDVLAIDMLYFGERDTGLFETFSNAEKAEFLYNRQGLYLDWVTQTVKDVGRSYDLLVDRDVDPARIVLIGISRGGQVAMIVGGAEARLSGVAALIAGHFDAVENGHRAAACPANYIGRISPRPLLMINGEHDGDYNKERSVLPLQALAGEPQEFHWNDVGHALPPESTATRVLDWLRRVPSR